MKKKTLALALALVLSAGTVYAEYTDISGHWAMNFIDELTQEGIVEGSGGSFRPDDSVNVDEFLKMTLTAMKTEVSSSDGYWAKPFIEKALADKLIYADEFESFNRPVTRGEIAKICVRAIGADKVSEGERAKLISRIYDYYDIYNDYKEYVLAAYANHILYGFEDNSFQSDRPVSRAQACVIISRMMKAGNFQGPGTDAPDVSNLYYVSNDGKDTNDGTIGAPFKTLEKARDKIREIISAGEYPEGGITVCLRDGDYVFDKSFELGAEDSGTKESPIVYTSYPGETARITGGARLLFSQFEGISADMGQKLIDKTAAKKVLQLDLNKAGITELGRLSRRGFLIAESGVLPQAELYIDGSRMQLSRWPNSDWAGTTEIVRSGARSQKGVLEGAVYKIDYDRPTKWKTNINEIYTSGVLGPNYFYGYFPIEKIEPGQITLKEGSVTSYYSKHFIRYENVFEEIDAPGEYYIDRISGMLYLYPPENFNENTDIRLSQLEENLISGSNVSNVTFKNIKLDAVRAGGVRVTGAKNFVIENCEVSGAGTNGIYISGTDCIVKNSIVHDIGSTGISINGGDYENIVSSGNVVENNHIYKAAQIERSYQSGITVGFKSVGVTVRHNEIHDMPHAAVIIYGPNHRIEYNNIYDAVKEFHDMDAIYLNVYQYPWERNVIIRRNYIHDLGQQSFTERQMNVAGIRSDNNGNGLVVEENIFSNIGYQNANGIRGVCAQGIENVIKNNIFINTSGTYEGAHTYNPDAKWNLDSETVKPIYEQWKIYSPKYSEQNPEVAHFFEHHFAAYEKNNIFKDNVIVNIEFPLGTANMTPSSQGFMASEQLVDASGNMVTKDDPGFEDYNNKDFTLKDDSEVFAQISGFPKLDFKNMGIEDTEAVGVLK
ncbi:MAG: S-layer homology domain-containing protein [Clostridiales bacterium]|nr:S-layer homology domain-containing protein [Clostridiales bacterium]